jgi:membrane protease YdiL (CAAX protease family)
MRATYWNDAAAPAGAADRKTGHERRGLWLACEFALLPLLVAELVPPAGWLPCLWLIAALAWWRLRRTSGVAPSGFWARIDLRRAAPELRRIGWRFALSAVVLVAVVAWLMPERLFDWPRHHPRAWLWLMLLYPVLSVYPQELVYRRFLFRRLDGLCRRSAATVMTSALAFAWMHLIFRNGWAVALTLIGGVFFADTYRRTGSLRLVCLEHALYGFLVFTIGFGDFFFHGAVHP